VPQTFHNYIDGQWVAAQSGATYENRNPANREDLVGLFPQSGAADVAAAVAAAKRAFASWRLVPAPGRAEILYRAAQLFRERKERFSDDMTREMGKVLA
jgi:acyl-CoA reductase-like NAD-dependent aldehyde dehydrogenase